jgi:hypothetical protein
VGNRITGRIAAVVVVGVTATLAGQQPGSITATQGESAKNAESVALGSIPERLRFESIVTHKEHRVKPLPKPQPTPQAEAAVRPRGAIKKLQATFLTPIEGIGGDNYTIESDPPDTNGAVGTTQYVEWVNTALAVFDKTTGNMVGHPNDGNSLFANFGGDCEQFNDGDPIVQFDKAHKRWVLSQFAVSGGEKTPGNTFSYCVAVSQSDDATQKYNLYEFKYADFPDYPKMSIWGDDYVVTFNMFHNNAFTGGKVCALNGASMRAGTKAQSVCVDVANQGGLLPADVDGATPPPAGAPVPVVNFAMDGRNLNLWRFTVNWNTPAASTLSGPTKIAVNAFNVPCDSCIVQPAGGAKLQTLGDRLMYRLAYRAFPNHTSLTVNHTVSVGGTTGIRWYELRDVDKPVPTVAQQGTYSPDGAYRWMGSTAMDKMGNLLLGYSVSSKSVRPSVAFSGRNATDPPGTLQSEVVLQKGAGVQTEPDRWGDYASVSIDPADDCTMFFATQYQKATGKFNWHTSIVRLRFPTCQ